MTQLFKSTKFDVIIAATLSLLLFLVFFHKINYFYIIGLIPLTIFLIRKPYLLIASLVFFGIGAMSYMLQKQHPSVDVAKGDYEIKQITSSGPIIKIGGNNVLVKTKKVFKLFDVIHVSGRVDVVENFGKSTFDYKAYLKTLNIRSIIQRPYIHLVSHSTDLRVAVKDFIISGPSNYKKIAPLVIMGFKTNDTRGIYNTAIELSIVHLFVISGFHISFIYLLMEKGLKLLKIHKYVGGWLPLTILVIYLFLMNFPLSAMRALTLHLLLYANKKLFKERFTALEILSLTMMIIFFWKPYAVTSLSFIFTFLATAVILIINTFEFKNEFRKYLAISFIVYISTLPISILINGYVAPLGFINGLVFTPVLIIMYPLSIILLPFKDVLDYIYIAFIFFVDVIDSINILITIPSVQLWMIQLIYLLSLSSFIIWVLWNLYMEKNNT